MKPAEHITAILRPHLDERGSIDIAAAEELLRNSDFDLDDFDPEGEGLANVLADMQLSFRIEHGPEADTLVCLLPLTQAPEQKGDDNPTPPPPIPPTPQPLPPRTPHPTTPPDDFDTDALNAAIATIIREKQAEAIANGAPIADKKMLLTDLGNQMKLRGLALPPGMKLYRYIASQASRFELTGDGQGGKYYIRNIGTTPPPPSPIRSAAVPGAFPPAPAAVPDAFPPAPAAVPGAFPPGSAAVPGAFPPGSPAVPGAFPPGSPAAPQPHQASIYELRDFAYFDDYVGALRDLAAMAMRGPWHTLPANSNPNPFLLLGYRLCTNFALGVERLVGGSAKATVAIAIDGATFDTGLITTNGRHIHARFAYNTIRDASRWQQYVFVGWTLG